MALFCHIIVSELFCHTINTVASEYLTSNPFKIAYFSDIVTHFSFLYILFLYEPFSCYLIKGILWLKFRFCNISDFHTATFSFNQTKYCHFFKILCISKIRWPSCDNERPLISMSFDSSFCRVFYGMFCEVFCSRTSGSQSFWLSDTFCTDDVSVVPLALPLIISREFAEGLCLTSEFFWLSKISISMNYHLNSSEQLCSL